MSEAAPTNDSKVGMGKNWYVIHTYAGFEGRVKTSLLERANQMALTEKMGQVLVPTEDVIEIKDGKRVPKGNRVANADGSWREEVRQGKCVTIKEKTAAGEYRETRRCD